MSRKHSGSLLGELLLAAGAITVEQLQDALERQKKGAGSLGQILVEMEAVSSSQLHQALRTQARLRGRQNDGRTYVLVVDDDPEVDAVVKDILEGAGYRVGVAQDGSEVIAAVLGEEGALPSLLLLDVGLPQDNGIDILSYLRSHAAARDLPVVVLTGNPAWEEEIHKRGLDIANFLTKPVNVAELLQAVESALSGAGSACRRQAS